MSKLPESQTDRVAPELVIRELETILASAPFKNSNRLSRFLRYVVNQALAGNAEGLKEYRIGLEVFERGPDFDPRIDPVVRVEARQLRFKLAKYYDSFGAADETVIGLPKGRYVPSFDRRQAQPAEPADATELVLSTPAEASIPFAHRQSAPPAKKAAWGWTGRLLAAAFAILLFIDLFFPLPVRWLKATLGLTDADKARVASHRVNPEAEALYMKGRYYWNKRTLEGLNQAVDCFTQSIVRDPGYAPAYGGLADAYNLLSEYTAMPYQEAFARALAAARKAVELDDGLANAHASLAFASFYGSWDAATADHEFNRALKLDPGYVVGRHWYATFLMTLGRSHEALAEIERAQKQDPTSTSILADKGLILFYEGQREQAIALLKQIEASEPSFLSSHHYLASIYLAAGRYSEYLPEYKNVALLSHDSEALEIISAGQAGLANGDARGMLQAMLKKQQQLSAAGRPGNYAMAQICSLLGVKRKALEYLQAALDQRDPSMLVLRIDPTLNPLHRESSFQELLRHVGLPPLN